MSISDPAQLLQRMPELEVLAVDPAVKRAIESGDPFKLYRALVWAKWLGRLPQHRDTLKLLLKQRRLFAKPLKRSPMLGTFNSVGFSFVGKAESDADGSHVALHALVVLFAIPVLPFGAYLVSSTGSNQWRIYARVPMGILGWLYSRGMALGLMATMLFGAASSYHKSQTQDITVLNAFPVPVQVVLGDKKQTVPAQGRITLNIATGKVEGSASVAKYGVIDTYSQEVKSHGGYTIWNIVGAMPLTYENVKYYKTAPSSPPAEDPRTVYCGQRYIEMSRPDFAFETPAKTVSMSKHDTVVSRSHLDIARVEGNTPLEMCTDYLLSVNQVAQAVPLFEAQALLSDWGLGLTNTAVNLATGSISPAEGVRIAGRAIAAKPDDVSLHRVYQTARDNAGQFDDLLREYAERAGRQPDSAAAQYLHAVLLKGPSGRTELESLARKFEQDPYILRALTWSRTAAGDYAGASTSYTRLKDISPKLAGGVIGSQVQALVAQKRLREALGVIAASFHEQAAHDPARDAGDFALVARLSGDDPLRLVTELSQAQPNAGGVDAIRVRAGLEPLQAAGQRSRLVNFALALRRDPQQALKLAHVLNFYELFGLQAEQLALLYCEAARAGDQALLKQMAPYVDMPRSDRQVLEQFVRGEAVSLDSLSLPPPVQAAAAFIRSRNAGLPPAERNALRQSAVRADLLHSVISSALQQWPA